MRRSESNTFLLPRRAVERIHCVRLLSVLCGSGVFEVMQQDAPDFVVRIGNYLIGIEVTQPNLRTKPQNVLRRWEEIAYESARLAGGLGAEDCRVNLYVDDGEANWLTHRQFDTIEFVRTFRFFLVELARMIVDSPRQISVHVSDDRVYVDYDETHRQLDRTAQLECLPPRFSFDAFSDDGRFQRPVINQPGTSWSYEDQAANRLEIVKAITRKRALIPSYRQNSGCRDFWLLVHYPSFGAPSFNAGEPVDWRLNFDRGSNEFERIFFLELVNDFYELDRHTGAVRRLES